VVVIFFNQINVQATLYIQQKSTVACQESNSIYVGIGKAYQNQFQHFTALGEYLLHHIKEIGKNASCKSIRESSRSQIPESYGTGIAP
jgi:hypothetical protein